MTDYLMNLEDESTSIVPSGNVQSEVEKQRVMQEVQALVLVAQKCPRNEVRAHKRIMDSAKRKTLAEKAAYVYPRGGQQVIGPSIRAAEAIAKNWGNLSFGIKELSQDTQNRVSEVMAYAWDLETNVRQERVFKVPHIRYSKNKGNSVLTDPRDVYEKVANDGARRLRACILGIIPSDIVEDFLNECEKTLNNDNSKPLKERIQDMISTFEKIGVTQEMIEKRVGTRADAFIVKNVIDLGNIYNSIKNNFGTIEQYFDITKEIENLEDVLGGKSKHKKNEELRKDETNE